MTQVVHHRITSRSRAPGGDFGGIIGETDRISTGIPAAQREPDYVAIRESPEFVALRRSFRWCVFPLAALFFLWYLTYVLLAAFAHGLMSHRLVGSVTVGLVLGLLQFASTIAITACYVLYARRRLDPQAEAIRDGVEAGR
ncbi:DUF485 domain-containing protein [Actinophytocola xanthii]|uniref:Clumping factor B n=1 Tax=Actinophytocola xanthii TaxID=1912961 RepID=A0A1Q8CNT3_9PSEU|nr:DUF485 domain-containing protein [Actinophytocola xanthii]OLF16019.1 hypothetical protein BU204_19180 [Actinophytocola xanthii]